MPPPTSIAPSTYALLAATPAGPGAAGGTIDLASYLLLASGPAAAAGPPGSIDLAAYLLLASVAPPAVVLPYDLLEAVAAYVAAAFSPAGKVHVGLAPPTPAYPYVRIDEIGETSSYISGGIQVAEGMLQITCLATTRGQAKRLGDAIRDGIKSAYLTYQAGYTNYLRQASRHLVPEVHAGPGGRNVFLDIRAYSYITILPR